MVMVRTAVLVSVMVLALVTSVGAQTQSLKAECNTWGGGHQRVLGTWDIGMVFVPGGPGMPDREEWDKARSQCFHENELVDGQIPVEKRPTNGMVIGCNAQQKWVKDATGTFVQKWFYPTQEPFCEHNPYQGWLLCGSNCIYPAEYYGNDTYNENPTATTTTTMMPAQ
jgi:hypothetical protein